MGILFIQSILEFLHYAFDVLAIFHSVLPFDTTFRCLSSPESIGGKLCLCFFHFFSFRARNGVKLDIED
jgi:hypothetical protein